jgi:hypothetical protein
MIGVNKSGIEFKKRLGYPEFGANTSIDANAFTGSSVFHWFS